MKTQYSSVAFDDAVADVSAGNLKTPQNTYLSEGRYPVIDQGQERIGGYTDDGAFLVKGRAPWLVFGDHTRALKFVDFPFCMGADGVKVLQPRNADRVDAKYLFHFLSANELPSAGYSRHFKFLRKLKIPLPPVDEQRRIAAILDKADALRRKCKQALDLLDSLTQSIFLEMFGPGQHREIELKDAVKAGTIVTYGIVQAGPEIEGGVPYIRTSDIVNGSIDQSTLRHTDPNIASRFARSRVEAGEIVMSIRATVGTTAIVPSNLQGANLTQGTARIAPGDQLHVDYLLAYLRSEPIQRWLKAQVKGATFLEITLGRLREMPVAVPPLPLQKKFAERRAEIKRVLQSAMSQKDNLDGLFFSLQHRAFSGQL